MKGEFLIIRDFFAPLAAEAPGAFGLTDDAALIGDFVVTKDMLIEGVHFLKTDPMDLVARKLVRVNVSDLAAKGAKPIGYFLACAWPSGVKRTAIEDFARGLKEDQTRYKIALYGGDTTRHAAAAGALTLSATFFGAAPRSGMVRRDGATAGDDLFVSGAIGDAGLGLAALQKLEKFSAADRDYLSGRYRLPEPRVTLGGALPGLANASIDVSDGLLADAGHLAERAGLQGRRTGTPATDGSRPLATTTRSCSPRRRPAAAPLKWRRLSRKRRLRASGPSSRGEGSACSTQPAPRLKSAPPASIISRHDYSAASLSALN